MTEHNEKTWSEVVEPIVRKFEVGASFELDVRFNPVGAKAMAGLIRSMAEKLDGHVSKKR